MKRMGNDEVKEKGERVYEKAKGKEGEMTSKVNVKSTHV